MSFNKNSKAFITATEQMFGIESLLTREDITRVVNESGAPYHTWFVTRAEFQ
jgi:hypothetical protein